MINYIRSEFYRSQKNYNLRHAILFLLSMILLLVVVITYLNGHSPNFPYCNTKYMLGSIYKEMPVMIVVLVFLSVIIDDSEFKNHTMKQSVAFGISRTNIYIGRFLVQCILCTLIYVVMSAILCGLSYALMEHSNVGELAGLIRVSLGGYTCLLAALAVVNCFLINSENIGNIIAASMLILMLFPIFLGRLAMKFEAARVIVRFTPYYQLSFGGPLVQLSRSTLSVCMEATLVGIGWLAAFLFLGIFCFKRKEVK